MPTPIASSLTPDSRNHADSAGFNLVIIYETLSAALWATETVTNLIRKVSDCPRPRLSAWRFSDFEDGNFRRLATADTLAAALIVVTASTAHRLLPSGLERWIDTCLAEHRGPTCALAALFRTASIPDGPDSPRLRAVEHLAKKNGCAFFAPFAQQTDCLHATTLDPIAPATIALPGDPFPAMRLAS